MLELGEPARDAHGDVPRWPSGEIEIDGIKVYVPYKNIGITKLGCEARAVIRKHTASNTLDSEEAIDATVDLAFVALRTNYPQLKRESLETLDDEDLGRILAEMNKPRGKAKAVAATTATLTTTELETPLSNGTISPS